MEKCYNKECDFFSLGCSENCGVFDKDVPITKCKGYKPKTFNLPSIKTKKIPKSEILKMAYDVAKRANWGFFINSNNEWYFDNQGFNAPEGNDFKSLYKKCKELLR